MCAPGRCAGTHAGPEGLDAHAGATNPTPHSPPWRPARAADGGALPREAQQRVRWPTASRAWWRKASTQTTKIAPMMTVTQAPTLSASMFCSAITMPAPDDRAEEGADAAQQGHQDHLAGHRPVHVGQRGETHHQRLQRAGQAGQRGRQHEGQQLVAVDVVAQRDGARLVLADHLEHLAERRVHDAQDAQEAGHEDRQHHVST
jgi:hypothetical protein